MLSICSSPNFSFGKELNLSNFDVYSSSHRLSKLCEALTLNSSVPNFILVLYLHSVCSIPGSANILFSGLMIVIATGFIQSVAFKEYCAELRLKEFQESMDRCTG